MSAKKPPPIAADEPKSESAASVWANTIRAVVVPSRTWNRIGPESGDARFFVAMRIPTGTAAESAIATTEIHPSQKAIDPAYRRW